MVGSFIRVLKGQLTLHIYSSDSIMHTRVYTKFDKGTVKMKVLANLKMATCW